MRRYTNGNSTLALSTPHLQSVSSESHSLSSSRDPVAAWSATSPAGITITEPKSSVLSDCDLPIRSGHRAIQDWRNNKSCIRARRSYDTTNTSSRVRFDTVAIRKYERLLDVGNSDIDLGLTIGWRYEELEPVSLNSIEPKDSHEIAEKNPRQRASIFLAWGYTIEELQNAINARCEQQNARAKKRVPLKNMMEKMKKRLSLERFRK